MPNDNKMESTQTLGELAGKVCGGPNEWIMDQESASWVLLMIWRLGCIFMESWIQTYSVRWALSWMAMAGQAIRGSA